MVEVMLSRLDERERQVFALRLLEDREFLEIAQRMGTTESAARSLFHRMREKLRMDD
jgi:RNA polymerase sigma factor (sigma-70 family)